MRVFANKQPLARSFISQILVRSGASGSHALHNVYVPESSPPHKNKKCIQNEFQCYIENTTVTHECNAGLMTIKAGEGVLGCVHTCPASPPPPTKTNKQHTITTTTPTHMTDDDFDSDGELSNFDDWSSYNSSTVDGAQHMTFQDRYASVVRPFTSINDVLALLYICVSILDKDF